MTVIINGAPIPQRSTPKKKKSGHTKPQAPQISLNEPGRLRVAHLLALFSISHSTFYARLHHPVDRFPEADGHDPRPYWKTETIKKLLEQ